tara:strand:+ start:8275 stop:8964 length:690 start_codon:yes stop_codon:yes gene_type:complete
MNLSFAKILLFAMLAYSSMCISAPLIVIKADDYPSGSKASWLFFFERTQRTKATAYIGVVTSWLSSEPAELAIAIDDFLMGSNHQVFFHGVNHDCSENSPFLFGFLSTQMSLLAEGKRVLEQRFTNNISAFGSPCNLKNQYTELALSASGYTVWLLGAKSCRYIEIQCFSSRLPFETSDLSPSLELAISHFNENEIMYVIQVHPGSWDRTERNEFTELLKFLSLEGVGK